MFWDAFEIFWRNVTQNCISLNLSDIIMGKENYSELLNYLLILGKWHIYQSSKNSKKPNFQTFKAIIKRNYEIERDIAKRNQKIDKLTQKWRLLESVISKF